MSPSEEAKAAKLGEGELPESRVLDHLGLVAGMFEELEIGDRIDEHIAQDFEEREVSIGQAVKAMVLNGFGFVQQRLYLTPGFFERVPTERLIGEGVRPSMGSVGDCYDNAMCESFFATIECELIEQESFSNRSEARLGIFDFVEGWYNRHSAPPMSGGIHKVARIRGRGSTPRSGGIPPSSR